MYDYYNQRNNVSKAISILLTKNEAKIYPDEHQNNLQMNRLVFFKIQY